MKWIIPSHNVRLVVGVALWGRCFLWQVFSYSCNVFYKDELCNRQMGTRVFELNCGFYCNELNSAYITSSREKLDYRLLLNFVPIMPKLSMAQYNYIADLWPKHHSFICSFIHSFVHSSIHSFIHSFIV